MKNLQRMMALILMLFGMTMLSVSQTSMDYNIMVEDIEFQPGITIDINVNVYVNENAHNWADHGKIFAIEGMAHAANCWKPFAEALFSREDPSLEVNEFFAIDMPGKGLSGFPEGYKPDGTPFLFGDLYLEDYQVVIRAVLSHLNADGIYPGTIMGHSQGGLEVMMLQQQLIDEGSNMRKAFRIKNAILLAPAPPNGCPWYFLTSGIAEIRLSPYGVMDPELGYILDIPFFAWPYNFFTNPFYMPPYLVPGAPLPSQMPALGYKGLEPGTIVYQVGGVQIPPEFGTYPYKPRPSVDPDIFTPNHGVQLTLFADQYDMLMQPSEMEYVYEMLTGDEDHDRFFVVMGQGTCHDTHISDPEALVEFLDSPYFTKSTIAGEETGSEINFSIFPNPADNEATISFDLPEHHPEASLNIYDLSGRHIYGLDISGYIDGRHQVEIDLSSLPAGSYLVRLFDGTGMYAGKLVKP